MAGSLLAETIDAAFDQTGRTYRDVANEVGLSIAYLHDLRKDRRGATPETARKLAVALGLEPETLVKYAAERSLRESFLNFGGCPSCGWPHDKK